MATSDRHFLRKWSLRGIVLLILLGVAGHIYYWYWPRPHPARPHPQSSAAGLVLGRAGPEMRLWIPFPHQNLASLADHLGKLEAPEVVMEEFLGAATPTLPSFGPFRLPPARDMALAIDQEGRWLYAVARVYPLAAWVFRAAGWLAGNPWMAGGDVRVGDETIRVSWQGRLWIASVQDLALSGYEPSLDVGPSLALLRLGERIGPVPEGAFRLVADKERLVLSSTLNDRPASPDRTAGLMPEGVILTWTRVSRSQASLQVQSLMALNGLGVDGMGLPPLLNLQGPGDSDVGRLPGEKILDVLGIEARSRSIGSWQLRAYEERLLDRGPELIEWLETLSRSGDPESEMLVGTLELEGAGDVFHEIAEILQQVPIIGEAEARRWQALAVILRALPTGSRMSFLVVEPDHVDVVIHTPDPD